jgi:DNA invertase Pin-like site-specific DNA recombinase
MAQALAYLRTSSNTNVGADKDSDVRQRLAIQGYASAQGIEIVAEFYDAGVSGADPIEVRPGFAAMLDRIEGNGVRTIIVEDASRFARDLMTQEAGLAMLASRNVRVLTASGDDLTASDDPMRTMMRQIVGAVMQAEKARLVAKLRGARDRKAVNGYRIEARSYAKKRPDLLNALRDLRTANPDATMQDLADRLTERGFTTSTGKPLARQAIHRTLTQMSAGGPDARWAA